MSWTLAQILELAPDASSRKAGQELAKPAKWSLLARNERCLWGEIKGSGASPYLAQVDLQGPAFKCSCPSRKFPCKHALGLLLILAAEPAALRQAEPPDGVARWLAGRDEKTKPATPAEPRDAEAQAALEKAQEKRRAARHDKVAQGLDALELWLNDLLRRGLASARTEGYGFWDRMAARLVDAQAPGLARRVKDLAGLAAQATQYAGSLEAEGRFAAAIGRLGLLLQAWRRVDSLSADLAAELRAAIGFPVTAEELDALPGVEDRWTVLAQQLGEDEDRLRSRSLWLMGGTGRMAQILDFAAGSRSFPPAPPPGMAFDGALVFHPGSSGLRAAIRRQEALQSAAPRLPRVGTVEAALDEVAAALGRTPWLERWPIALKDVRLLRLGEGFAIGEERVALPLQETEPLRSLVAVVGDRPLDLFGLWDGGGLLPLALVSQGRLYSLSAERDDPVLRRVA